MNLLAFEFKKLSKQKKYIWALLVVILITSAVFWMNSNQRSKLQGNWVWHAAIREEQPLNAEWSSRESDLILKRDEEGLNSDEQKQLEYSREIGLALQRMGIAKSFDMYEDYNRFEKRFLDNLHKYSQYGGEFSALEGIEREIRIAKNAWRMDNDIPYEFEASPVSQHLFLAQSTSVLLGIVGIAILIILFGNSMTEEKENFTWQTIKTQPISKANLVLSKYINLILISVVFIVTVVLVGTIVPVFTQGWTLNFTYPQVITSEESFTIITTGEYIIRAIVLFFFANCIAMSISLLMSKWAKKSITLYFLVGIVLAAGYLTTSLITSPLNPFSLFNFNEILNNIPQSSDWLYILSAVVWSSIFLILAIKLPESQTVESKLIKDDKPFAKGKTKGYRKILLNLYTFEWRKVRREGILKTLTLVILILVVGGHFFLTNQTEQREREYLAELEWRVSASYENIASLYEQIEEYEEKSVIFEETGESDLSYFMWDYYGLDYDENIYEHLITLGESYIDNNIEGIEKVEAAIEAYNQGDWEPFYEYQLYVNERALENTYPDGQHIGAPETLRRFTKLVNIHEKELLMERNIKPVLSGEFISTIHEFWGRQNRMGWRGEPVLQDQWAYENKKVDNSGLFYLYLSFTHYIYLIPLALLLFFIGGGMAREKGKKITFNFLKTQPISEEKMYAGKVINTTIITIITVLIIPLLVILTGTILNRFGDWNYPILHYSAYSESMSSEFTGYIAGGYGYHFIDLGKYLIDSVILFIPLALLVVATSNFLSLFFKRTLGVWAATIVILGGGYWLNGRNPLQVSSISPFTYFNIPKIVNGEVAAKLNDPGVTVFKGAIILLVLALGIMVLGYWIIYKKKHLKLDTKSTGKMLVR